MSYHDWLTTTEIHEAFAAEVQAAGGTVTEAFDDGRRLFARSVLPRLEEVRPRDQVQGGVALRAEQTEVWVYPYVFRLVCRNGAIWAHALESRSIKVDDCPEPEEAITAIRETVQACCADEVFAARVSEMRTARTADATDTMLNMMAMLGHLSPRVRTQVMQSVLGQFASAGDSSRFGLMNAVTATAREIRDPELRWRLEEFGGGIAALRTPKTPPGDSASEMLEELVLVSAGSSGSARERLAAS
jgi:hypothetical protein